MMKNNNKIPVGLLIGVVGVVAFVLAIALVKMQSRKTINSEPNDIVSRPTSLPTVTPITETITQPIVKKPVYPSGWQEYKNEKDGYTIAHPLKTNVNGYSYDVLIDEAYDASYVVVKGIDAMGSIAVKNKNVEDTKKEIISKYVNPTISEKKINFNGYEATQLTFESKGEYDLITINVLIEHDGKTYNLMWGSTARNSELSYDSFGKQIFKMFHLD